MRIKLLHMCAITLLVTCPLSTLNAGVTYSSEAGTVLEASIKNEADQYLLMDRTIEAIPFLAHNGGFKKWGFADESISSQEGPFLVHNEAFKLLDKESSQEGPFLVKSPSSKMQDFFMSAEKSAVNPLLLKLKFKTN